jgi:predicted RecB family nuclease
MTTQEPSHELVWRNGEAVKHHLIPLHGESSRLYATGARERHPIGALYGVGTQHAEAFRRIGIETVEDLLNIEEIEGLDESTGVPDAILRKTRLRAVSYVSMETYQIHPFEFPAEHQIFIDIETDVQCRRVWLIGLLIDGVFTQLYAESWENEKRILEEFLALLSRNEGYSLVSYSGTGFDYRITLNACRRHGLDANVLESFNHIDLCTVLRRCFVFPYTSYALKELGGFLRYGFKQTELDGLAVARAYQRHVEHGVPLGAEVLEYNEDDVRVMKHLVDTCFSLRKHIHSQHTDIIHVNSRWAYVTMKLDEWL